MSRLVHVVDSCTPHKPDGFKNIWSRHLVIWLSSYDHLTDVGGQRGSCQRKGACWLLNKKEALYGLIQVNDDEERNGCQQWYLGVSNPGYIPVYQKNSCTLLFSGLRSPYATGVLPTLFSVWIKRGWMNVFSRYL